MRMFVDMDSFQGLTALQGVLKARERFADTMALQICAFPQEGLFTNPDSLRLMEQAMEMGAEVVGGIPWVEWDDEAVRCQLQRRSSGVDGVDQPRHLRPLPFSSRSSAMG